MTRRLSYDVSGLDALTRAQLRDALSVGSVVPVESASDEICIQVEDESMIGFIEELVGDVKSKSRRLRSKLVREHRATATYAGDLDAVLAGHGEVHALGSGLVGLRGDLLRALRFFETEFRGWADEFQAEEQLYPVMLPIEILEEVGYFGHFPQHVTLCGHLPEDLVHLDRIARDAQAGGGRLAEDHRRALAGPAHVLQPAVCLPCYRQQRGRVLQDGGGFALTVQNHVFRYEARSFRPLARLWDFQVRDIVLFGAPEQLSAQREAIMDRALELCRELDLDARIELANDPFFFDPSRDKRVYQRLSDAKYELALSLPHRDEVLAVSSFNLHRDFYARIYDIRFTSGELVETACMGFGLERWLYGLLAQKGPDPDAWPERLRAFVGAGNGEAR